MAPIHFRCNSCGADRELTELSEFSQQSFYAKGDKSRFLFCRYCAPEGSIPRSLDSGKLHEMPKNALPPQVRKFLDTREYWERRVTDDEVKGPVMPVVEDRLLTYAEASQKYNINKNTIAGWAFQKRIDKVYPNPADKKMVRVKDSQVAAEAAKMLTAPATRTPRTHLTTRVRQAMALRGVSIKDVAGFIGCSPSGLQQALLHRRSIGRDFRNRMESWIADPTYRNSTPLKKGGARKGSGRKKKASKPVAVVQPKAAAPQLNGTSDDLINKMMSLLAEFEQAQRELTEVKKERDEMKAALKQLSALVK